MNFRSAIRLSLSAVASRFALFAADLSSAPWLGHVTALLRVMALA
jgi:hypothetical protein